MSRFFLPVLLVFHLTLLYFTRFTLWPEMVVYPYLLNNGFRLYTDIINPYTPLLIYALTFFGKLFGSDPYPYKILTWLVVLTIDILIFKISKMLTNSTKQALLSLAFFTILSVPFGINGLWFDLVQTPFVLASVYFFFKFTKDNKKKNSILLSVVFLTIAVFIKQQALWLGVFYALYLVVTLRGKLPRFILENYKMVLVPILASVLHLAIFSQSGQLQDFLYWTVYFPLIKSSSQQGYQLLPTAKQVATVALLFLAFVPSMFSRKNDQKFLTVAAASLLLFAYPRFDYFHLIPALATLALVFPKSMQLSESSKITRSILLVSVLILIVFSARYLGRNQTKEVRFFEPEILQTAKVVEMETSKSDAVYIQNGPDQVFALANRLPPKPWADEFPWYLELPNVQQNVVAGIVASDPKIVIYKPYENGAKYGLGVYRPDKIADFLDDNFKNSKQISPSFYLKTK